MSTGMRWISAVLRINTQKTAKHNLQLVKYLKNTTTWTVRLLDTSPIPLGHFAYETLCLQDSSPITHGHFAYATESKVHATINCNAYSFTVLWVTLELNIRLKGYGTFTANIYTLLDGIGEWFYYNFATGSFHTKKLCRRVFDWLQFYSQIRFLSHPLGS